ncbi:MAG: hypothetical protein ABGZ17_11810 [Planctomycetaceae bacterium]
MADHQHDREDIMREATAMTRRVELECAGAARVVTGFRQLGWFSLYVDQDPVYHFDADGRLRRAFVDGFLYRSQGGFLARLSRRRSAGVSELLRTDLIDEELHRFLEQMCVCCRRLHTAIMAGDTRTVAQVPADDAALLDDVAAGLQRTLCLQPAQALAAAINKRRD